MNPPETHPPPWVLCSERMPELIHSHDGGGLITGRRWSDPVVVRLADGFWSMSERHEVCTGVMLCGMKTEEDWGKAPPNTYFWMYCGDLFEIHGKPDAPWAWRPATAAEIAAECE